MAEILDARCISVPASDDDDVFRLDGRVTLQVGGVTNSHFAFGTETTMPTDSRSIATSPTPRRAEQDGSAH